MKKRFYELKNKIDIGRVLEHTAILTDCESGQTFREYHRSARRVMEILKERGITGVEMLEFPADGKTVYQDKRMPLAWEAGVGRLTLLNAELPGTGGKVVADYARHPFHMVKGSVATPRGGTVVKIITESQFRAGESPRGNLVMLNPFTFPKAEILRPILDGGGLGFISDYLAGREESRSSVQWVNACTEGDHWHVQCEDRPFRGLPAGRHRADSGQAEGGILDSRPSVRTAGK